MYTEALDAIQKDVDNLTQENRALKEKAKTGEATLGVILTLSRICKRGRKNRKD
jgi:hypothetical protein